MTQTDSWGELNKTLADPNPMIEMVEAMGALPGIEAARQSFFAALEIGPGQTVLDVGCGPATALPMLLELMGQEGQIKGIDPTVAFIEYARHKATQLSATQAVYEVGDARKLEVASESCDVVFCDKVLLHAGPSETILGEMWRVVKPGGMVGALEYDCDTWALNGRDLRLTRRVIEANRDEQYDGFMGRKLPGLFRQAGLHEVKFGHFAAFSDQLNSSAYWPRCLEIMSERAVKRGIFNEVGRAAWLTEQTELDQAGHFWICVSGFWAVGRK